MWMEEQHGNRVNVERTRQAPRDRRDDHRQRLPVLHDDAVRRGAAEARSEEVRVLDLAELLLQAVETGGGPEAAATVAHPGEKE